MEPIVKEQDPPRLWAEDEAPPETVVGPDGEPLEISRKLTLGVEKFPRPQKHYRLIWLFAGEAWLCNERQTRFHTKGGAVMVGQEMAEQYGVKFSEITR